MRRRRKWVRWALVAAFAAWLLRRRAGPPPPEGTWRDLGSTGGEGASRGP